MDFKKGFASIEMLVVILVIAAVGLVVLLIGQNSDAELSRPKLTDSTYTPIDESAEEVMKGEVLNFEKSPIIENPLDTSSWKDNEFALSRAAYDNDENVYTQKYFINFRTPFDWTVVEYDKSERIKENSVYGKKGQEAVDQSASYEITNSDGTLKMTFTKNEVSSPEIEEIPKDSVLVKNYRPDPSGGSAKGWILRHSDKAGRIYYKNGLSDQYGNPLTTADTVTGWVVVQTEPLGWHGYGEIYYIAITYSGSEQNYGINISTADQILSLLIKE